ncbi:MAG: hypothetical protein ACJA0V_003380 [Planctomycetota bacterium]|jgi:hypothetical protein
MIERLFTQKEIMAREPQFKLSLGKLVSQSFRVYLRNFVPFVLLSVVILSPWIVFSVVVPVGPEDTGMQFVGMLLSMLMTYVLTGALTFGVVQQLRGKPASMAEAVSKGMQALLRALGTGILCGIRIFLFSLLLFIPGIWEQLRLYVALPVAIMENTSGSAAIARSIRLTDGSKWQIFGAWFVMFTLPILIVTVVVVTYTIMSPDGMVPAWINIVVQLAIAPLAAVAMAVCYFLLREGKENKSVEEIAAVFD